MCEVRSREKRARKNKIKYSGQQQKEMECDEPHSASNEKTQPIQWTERPTGALVAVNSLWPMFATVRPKQVGNNWKFSFISVNSTKTNAYKFRKIAKLSKPHNWKKRKH
jgi:hypothetical protein